MLKPESWDLILSPMTLNSGRDYPYRFGWFIEEAGGQVVHQHGGAWRGFVTQYTRSQGDDLAVVVLSNARTVAPGGLAGAVGALYDPALAPPAAPGLPIADPDPVATAYVREILGKVAAGDLELSDFDFVRQTLFPRMRAALTGALQGRGAPTRMELLSRREVGDDVEMQYFAWFGAERFRVVVSLGPGGGLTGLRVSPEPGP